MSETSFDDWEDKGDDDSLLNGYDTDDILHNNPSMQQMQRAEYPVPETSSEVHPRYWNDVLVSAPGKDVQFTIDTSTKSAWKKGISDVEHLRQRIQILISKDEEESESMPESQSNKKATLVDLFNLTFGYERSTFANVFAKELSLDKITFLKFIGNLFLQMSYKEAPSQLYVEES